MSKIVFYTQADTAEGVAKRIRKEGEAAFQQALASIHPNAENITLFQDSEPARSSVRITVEIVE